MWPGDTAISDFITTFFSPSEKTKKRKEKETEIKRNKQTKNTQRKNF